MMNNWGALQKAHFLRLPEEWPGVGLDRAAWDEKLTERSAIIYNCDHYNLSKVYVSCHTIKLYLNKL